MQQLRRHAGLRLVNDGVDVAKLERPGLMSRSGVVAAYDCDHEADKVGRSERNADLTPYLDRSVEVRRDAIGEDAMQVSGENDVCEDRRRQRLDETCVRGTTAHPLGRRHA